MVVIKTMYGKLIRLRTGGAENSYMKCLLSAYGKAKIGSCAAFILLLYISSYGEEAGSVVKIKCLEHLMTAAAQASTNMVSTFAFSGLMNNGGGEEGRHDLPSPVYDSVSPVAGGGGLGAGVRHQLGAELLRDDHGQGWLQGDLGELGSSW